MYAENAFTISIARNCPASVQVLPMKQGTAAIYISYQGITRIYDILLWTPGSRISHQMLNMSSYTNTGRREVTALYVGTCRTKTAIVILLRQNSTAVTEKTSLLYSLNKGNIWTDTLDCSLFIIAIYQLLRRNSNAWVRIMCQ